MAIAPASAANASAEWLSRPLHPAVHWREHPRHSGRRILALRPEIDEAPSLEACHYTFAGKCSPLRVVCARCGPPDYDFRECLWDPHGENCNYCYRCVEVVQPTLSTANYSREQTVLGPGTDWANVSNAPTVTRVDPPPEQDWGWTATNLGYGERMTDKQAGGPDAAAAQSSSAAAAASASSSAAARTAARTAARSAAAARLLELGPSMYSINETECSKKADDYCGPTEAQECFRCYGTAPELQLLAGQAQQGDEWHYVDGWTEAILASGPRHWNEQTGTYEPPQTDGPIGGPPDRGRYYWCFRCKGDIAAAAGGAAAAARRRGALSGSRRSAALLGWRSNASDASDASDASRARAVAPPAWRPGERSLPARRAGAEVRRRRAAPPRLAAPRPSAPLPLLARPARPSSQQVWNTNPSPLWLVSAFVVLHTVWWFMQALGLDVLLARVLLDPRQFQRDVKDWLKRLKLNAMAALWCGWFPGGCSKLPKVPRKSEVIGPFGG